jgi:hypothetical protein
MRDVEMDGGAGGPAPKGIRNPRFDGKTDTNRDLSSSRPHFHLPSLRSTDELVVTPAASVRRLSLIVIFSATHRQGLYAERDTLLWNPITEPPQSPAIPDVPGTPVLTTTLPMTEGKGSKSSPADHPTNQEFPHRAEPAKPHCLVYNLRSI